MASLNQLENDLVAALKSRDENKKNTLRLIISAVKYVVVDLRAQGKELTEDDVNSVLKREAKKRRESIEIYSSAGRNDLADAEKIELEIIESYLPQQLSKEVIERVVAEVLETTQNRDFGNVMKETMVRLKGQADGKDVAEVVKLLLNN